MSTRSLHRPSLIAPGEEHEAEEARPLSLVAANHSIAATPYLITQLRPFVPFSLCRVGEPFTAKQAWKGVISGIRALQRMRITGGLASGPMGTLKSDLVVISAHEQGHVMVWSADTLHAIGSCTHFNNVTVQQLIVSKTMIFTRVERNMSTGKAGDDDEVYVWDLQTMTLKTKLSAHEDRVTALAVLEEDENLVVTGGVDKTIFVWDVTRPAKPVSKLTGHTSTITALQLSGHLLVSGSADGFIKTWNITTKECIQTMEGHQGAVTYLQWYRTYKEALKDLQARRKAEVNAQANGQDEEHPVAIFVAACSGGVVRGYHCNKQMLQSPWQVKAHRAFITDVCWDDDIYISSSMAESAINFYKEGRSVNYKGLSGSDVGIRHLAVDRTRKMVMGGSDSGLLCFWSYKGLVSSSDPDNDCITLLLSLQPHLGSISNLLLERSENSQWERLVSTSNDNTIFCMDFDVNRDSKSYHGVGSRCSAVTNKWSGSLILASELSISVWDSESMTKRPLSKKIFEGHTDLITSLRFSQQHSRLISASVDSSVRCWEAHKVETDQSSPSDDAEATEEVFVSSWSLNLGMPIVCLSEPVANVIAAGCRKQNSKLGAISVIDIQSGNEVIGAMPTAVFPVSITVLVQQEPKDHATENDNTESNGMTAVAFSSKSADSSPERSKDPSASASSSNHAAPRYVHVIVQLRNGEIQIFSLLCSGNGVNTATPLRTIVPQQVEFYPSDSEDKIDQPFSPFLASLDEKYDPPRINLTFAVDPKTIRHDQITPGTPARPDVSKTTNFAANLLSKIETLTLVNQSGIFCAAGCEMGTVYLIKPSGDVAFKIRYDGSVIDTEAEELRPARTRRCYFRLPGEANTSTPATPHQRFPACSFIRATLEARCIAIGYADGMIQIFDLVARRICRRISSHGSVVRHCEVMPNSPRIFSLSKSGTLRFDTLYGRHVNHQGKTLASAVTAAFNAGS